MMILITQPNLNTYEAEIMQDMYLNKKKYTLGNIPLIVISGGNKRIPEGDKNWSSEQLVKHRNSLQKDLLNLSTNSKQIIAKKSGHNVHIDEPKVFVRAIRKLIKMKR
jgi:pimeloyl-ACP methyl ester carboxylesterase